jgi:hypothetical protein
MRCYHHADTPATVVCLGCLRALCEVCASRHEHYCERGYKPSLGAAAVDQPCHHHAFEAARGICAGCGQPICVRCAGMVDGQLTCPDCREREVAPSRQMQQVPQEAASWRRALGVVGVTALALVIALVVLLAAGVVALPGSVSAQTGASGSSGLTDLVERHYALIEGGEYQLAWQQLSPSAQSRAGYAEWANSYAGTRITPSALEVSSLSAAEATVVGDVAIGSDGAAQETSRGQWTLCLVDGAWRLDSSSFTSAVSRQR